jgi:hypothetical protein
MPTPAARLERAARQRPEGGEALLFFENWLQVGLTVAIGLLSAAVIVLLGLALALRSTVTDLERGQGNQIVNQAKGQAAVCRMQRGLGMTLQPHPCGESRVTAFYDPNEPPVAGATSPGQIRNARLICGLYATQPAECASIGP